MSDKTIQHDNSTNRVLDVAILPALIKPESLSGQTVIAVDVLRATTTIINALHNGCKQVLPQPSVEAARETFQSFEGKALIGGERQGQIVDGFHNGNSPIEYVPDVIADKTLILATTNVTVAMEHCRNADRVLIGAMVNIGALAKLIEDDPTVTVVCSGTDRFVTSEDVIFAGALMDRLIENRTAANKPVGQLTDTATIAVNHWRSVNQEIRNGKLLADFFRNAKGGINLVKIGHDLDIIFASQIDALPVVPELDLKTWSIRLNA